MDLHGLSDLHGGVLDVFDLLLETRNVSRSEIFSHDDRSEVLDGSLNFLRDEIIVNYFDFSLLKFGLMLIQALLGVEDGAISFVLEINQFLICLYLRNESTLRFLSSSLNFSALLIMSWISLSLSPPELWMVIEWSRLVALSLADTWTIPLASMSKVTSIYGTPLKNNRGEHQNLGAGGIPPKSNYPSILLSAAISRSPWNTRIDTTVWLSLAVE